MDLLYGLIQVDSIEQSGAEVVDLINSADIPPAGVTGHVLNIKA